MKATLFIYLLLTLSKVLASYSSIKELNETEYDRFPTLIILDDYRRCLWENQGVYCLAKFTLHAEPGNKLLNLIHDYSSHRHTHFNHSYVERGICVRKSCLYHIEDKKLDDDKEMRGVLESCVNESLYKEYKLQVRINKIYNCDRSNDKYPEKDLSDWLVAGYFITLIILVLVGSVYDSFVSKDNQKTNNNKGNKYLLCFSVFRNWHSLVTTTGEKDNEHFKFLHGIRCILAFFVIYVHSLFVFAILPDDIREYEMAYKSLFLILFNGLPVTKVFFMISGILLVSWLQRAEKNETISWSSVPKLILGRWFRLAMPYLSVFALATTWFRYAGFGPLWNHLVLSNVYTCRKYWWAHFLFVNNLVAEDVSCMYQTWSLAAEMQLFVLGLALHLATNKRPRLRNTILCIMILLGLVIPCLHVWLGDYDASTVAQPEMYRTVVAVDSNDSFVYMHIRTHNNLLFYFTGMAMGYFVDYCQSNKCNFKCNKQICNLLVWSLIPCVLGVFMTMPWFYEATLISRVVYAAVYQVMLAVPCVCGGIPLLLKWDDTGFRKFLEWHGWVVPSRLSYLVFLLHAGVILNIIGRSRQMVQFSILDTFQVQLGIVSISLLAALPLYLIVEGPMSALLKCFNSDTKLQPRKSKTI